jgi:hypothetical protein
MAIFTDPNANGLDRFFPLFKENISLFAAQFFRAAHAAKITSHGFNLQKLISWLK